MVGHAGHFHPRYGQLGGRGLLPQERRRPPTYRDGQKGNGTKAIVKHIIEQMADEEKTANTGKLRDDTTILESRNKNESDKRKASLLNARLKLSEAQKKQRPLTLG